MKTHGGLHKHRGQIALTGAFLAAFSLLGCGHEKTINPQEEEMQPVQQVELALHKPKNFTVGKPSITPTLRNIVPPEKIYSNEPDPVTAAHAEPELTLSAPQPTQCWMGDVTNPLREVVTSLEEQSLLYNTGPLTDCSGIFHRVLQGLKHRCPGRDFPTVEKNRNSRALARWYHERGKLQLIKNAEESATLLKPGAIIFFGRNGSVYEDFSVDDLLTPRKGIAHLGVVVKVHKDESGKVLHYELFHGHGRKGITAASVTNWHKRTPTRNGYPPFGNGRQQWVAVARI